MKTKTETGSGVGGKLIVFLSTGAYLGLAPKAPGTFGTLAGIPIYLLLSGLPVWLYIIATALIVCFSIWVASKAEKLYPGHDDGRIVIDEVDGYLATMTAIAPSVVTVILGFVLFRIFDILKPWPCRTIDERWPGGAGVVMDDVAAGIYSCAVMHLIMMIRPDIGRLNW